MNLLPLEPLPEDEEQEKRDAEARARFEALRDEDPDLEKAGWRLVSRGPRHKGAGATTTFSFRLEPKEITEIANAAEARGMNMSEFIRAAALTVARSGHQEPPVEPTRKLPSTVEEAEAQITQAYERAILEVRYIREVAERDYHVDAASSENPSRTDVASKA